MCSYKCHEAVTFQSSLSLIIVTQTLHTNHECWYRQLCRIFLVSYCNKSQFYVFYVFPASFLAGGISWIFHTKRDPAVAPWVRPQIPPPAAESLNPFNYGFFDRHNVRPPSPIIIITWNIDFLYLRAWHLSFATLLIREFVIWDYFCCWFINKTGLF